MSELEFDYEIEFISYIIRNNLWDKKKNKLKEEVYHVYETRNQKLDKVTGGYYGGEQYLKGFTTKRPKPVKLTHCRSCFKEFTRTTQREYCDTTCKQNGKELRIKKEELVKKFPNFQAMFWNEDKEFEKPEWKDIVGVFKNNGKIEYKTNIITNKSHRGSRPRKPKNEPKDFTKGKDHG